MMSIDVLEARTYFLALLLEVERGKSVTITRHGVAIARLVPVSRKTDDARAAMAELHHFRRERRPTLDGFTIRELVAEGRV